MKLIFRIDPVPASRPRVTRWATYYAKPYEQFMERVKRMLENVPKTLLEGELRSDISFYKLIPISFSKKKREAMDGTYCVSNFDLDNLEKAIYDTMNEHVYMDDSQIVEHTTRKKWTKDNPRIEVLIKPITYESTEQG